MHAHFSVREQLTKRSGACSLHGAMSPLCYCKRKGGGEPPSPKRSWLKTIIDGKERDGVVQSDEGEGMLRYPLRKQGKGTPAEILYRKRNVLLSVPEVQQEPLCSWHLEHSAMH